MAEYCDLLFINDTKLLQEIIISMHILDRDIGYPLTSYILLKHDLKVTDGFNLFSSQEWVSYNLKMYESLLLWSQQQTIKNSFYVLVESKLTHLKALKNGSLVGVRNITLLWLLKGLSLKKKSLKERTAQPCCLKLLFLVKANKTTKVKITENLTWTWVMLHVVRACDFQISWWSIKLIRKYKHSGSCAAKGFLILIVYVNISILSCPLVMIHWWYSVWPWRRQIMCRPAQL